ncbi:MAG: hypothetical protein O7E52_14720 [Candidatus Poribacteria bacterium]|nr:hypothetical protein [Candidatus Poribacteria bacterium]
MLYLNSIENAATSKTERKYAICHEKVPGMQHISELAPPKGLLDQWQSQRMGWDEFREKFTEKMRTEYRKEGKSRLRGLAKYSLENDVTLHSPEPSGEQTYRAILGEIITGIWKRAGRTERVIDLARPPVEASQLTEADRQQMEEIAAACKFFTPKQPNRQRPTCQVCQHLDQQVYMCPMTKQVVIHYEWATPLWIAYQA